MTPVGIRHAAVRFARTLDRASVRREEGAYLAEGLRLVGDAIATRQPCRLLLIDRDALNRSPAGSQILESIADWAEQILEITPEALRRASQTENPAGVLAILRMPAIQRLESGEDGFGLVLDGLSDPGNAGTILRTAAAFGVSYVVTTPSSVDLFSPKVVRAGMGAHFRLPLHPNLNWHEISRGLPSVEFVAAAPEQGEDVRRLNWPKRGALVIGSEATGLSAAARSHVRRYVHIPMRSGVESLNAAASAAILLFSALGGAGGSERLDTTS